LACSIKKVKYDISLLKLLNSIISAAYLAVFVYLFFELIEAAEEYAALEPLLM
jgi:hypothetical protein